MASKANEGLVLGVDLGGTKTLVAVIDPNNQILGRGKLSTPARQGGDAIVEVIIQAAEIALAEAGKSLEEISLVGIGSPGPLDVKAGVILFSANMDVVNYPLAARLHDRLKAPVVLRNDVRAGCYAEWKLGAGQGMDNLIGAFVGTGLGGCVILNGQVIEGKNGNAGEIGHIKAKPNGRQCGCGLYGCLELYASKSGLMKRFDKAKKNGVTSLLFSMWNGCKKSI